MFNIKGSIVALITPFHEDGSVNFEKLKELLEWHVEKKTDAILILGTTGESATMTHEEDDDVVQCAIETINGRIPVMVGSGSNCTRIAIEKSIEYADMGADALLVVSPYYNKANAQGMIQHFTAVADAVNKPIILYNIPGRTGCSISPQAIKVLSQHPNICGIKEASGSMSYVSQIAPYLNDNFTMYSGNDDMILPMLSMGGSGVISVLANILPEETHDMVMDYIHGEHQKALNATLKYMDVIHSLFIEVNPIPVKEALNIIGKEVGGYRLPLCEMAPENKAILEHDLHEVGL